MFLSILQLGAVTPKRLEYQELIKQYFQTQT